MKNREIVLNICYSGIYLAIALILPLFTGQISQTGSMLLPMHLPIMICGIMCGWKYGVLVGAVAPLLRFVLFGMPPIYPTAIAMSFELAAYGAVSGFIYDFLKDKIISDVYKIYISLIIAMIIGRILWGMAMFGLLQFDSVKSFTFTMFLSGAIITAWPGIILQLILVPTIVLALNKLNNKSKIQH